MTEFQDRELRHFCRNSAVYLTALKLFSGPHAPHGRKAIILLTDGQDSGLKLTWNPASMFPPDNTANWLA